ncbi:dihydrodipicolinate synthase family protein [Novosphingobium sp. UBA1939]|uniref:dihydrodipicolinate synthase family protein n=1 Tax=Novosphingobium sp. UBA1939 TaxID=1946982 RepID=UPI0025DC10F3|nr:dihydrodipicolinate synthase family protein [Novosphingobium sp. UBA1939]
MILGAVLAGGQSSRFGSDKALAELDGRTLLARAVEALQAQCDAVVVVGREDAPVPTLPDRPRPGMGPLGGIAAALHHAAEAGYDAISAIPPFYYDFSRDELKAHYRALGGAVPLPLIVYNFGGRVGRLTNADLLELLDEPKVIGIKHTSQDLYLLERFKRHRPEAVIYNGFDEMCLAGLIMGADGAIGTTYNFMGDLFVRLAKAFAEGRIAEARALQVVANRVIDVLIEVGVFPGTKGILTLMGIDVGICREPFRALTDADRARLADCVALLRQTAEA